MEDTNPWDDEQLFSCNMVTLRPVADKRMKDRLGENIAKLDKNVPCIELAISSSRETDLSTRPVAYGQSIVVDKYSERFPKLVAMLNSPRTRSFPVKHGVESSPVVYTVFIKS